MSNLSVGVFMATVLLYKISTDIVYHVLSNTAKIFLALFLFFYIICVMKKISFVVIFLIVSLLACETIRAEEEKPKCLEAVEFLTGFGWGKLRHQKNYNLTPFIVDFDFNLKPLTQKINFNPRSLLQFQIEPFISYISSPKNNVETGTSFLLKAGFLPQTSKFQPFVLGGVGMVYMTQHTIEQSTQFNFIEQLGIGMHYFFKPNVAFTIEGRYRHLSNAGIDHPNTGINTQFVLTGISYQF